MSHGPQHWKINWQGKDCHTVQRITTNITWSSSKVFFGSSGRSPRSHDERQKTLLQEEVASTKRNLMSVGGHTDTPVDLDTSGNVDEKRPCLDNSQTVLMRTPTQDEFVECWIVVTQTYLIWWEARRVYAPISCTEHLFWGILHNLLWWNWVNSKEPKLCVHRKRDRQE